MKRAMFVAGILGLLVVMVLVGCTKTATSTTTGAAAVKVLKIGGSNVLSGDSAIWGQQSYRGALMAQEDINKAGGIVVNGERYVVNMTFYDDQFSPDVALSAANKLIFNDKVKFVVSTGSGGIGSTLYPLYTANKVLSWDSGWDRDALAPANKYNFQPSTTPAYYYLPLVQLWRQKFPNQTQRVSILNPNAPYGQDSMDQAKIIWPKTGSQILSSDFYELTTADFTPLLTSVLAKKPDFIDLSGSYPYHVSLLIKQARDMGFTGMFGAISWTYIDAPPLNSLPAKYLEGFLFVVTRWDLPTATADQAAFYQRYIASYGPPFYVFSPVCYEATMMTVNAIVKAQSFDVDKVAAALDSTPPISLFGSAKWGGAEQYGAGALNREALYNTPAAQVVNGKSTIIGDLPVKWYKSP